MLVKLYDWLNYKLADWMTNGNKTYRADEIKKKYINKYGKYGNL